MIDKYMKEEQCYEYYRFFLQRNVLNMAASFSQKLRKTANIHILAFCCYNIFINYFLLDFSCHFVYFMVQLWTPMPNAIKKSILRMHLFGI